MTDVDGIDLTRQPMEESFKDLDDSELVSQLPSSLEEDRLSQWRFAFKALKGSSRREGFLFLVNHMPEKDLVALPIDTLLSNINLAYRAREIFPWASTMKEETFLNNVLPYALLDEKREDWRPEMFRLCSEIVTDAKDANQAVALLNTRIFPLLKVSYSTKRNKPNQSISESVEQGLASCTGLSIILASACRSVGIPARLVGIPKWTDSDGNHTWIEFLFDDRWHFTGAAEQDLQGPDRGWFVGKAALALRNVPANAIYATSFERRPILFPMVWNPSNDVVFAENVTDRYAPSSLSPDEAKQCRKRLWDSHCDFIHKERAHEHQHRIIQMDRSSLVMPFSLEICGGDSVPAGGRSLFISMHGGGGCPAQVNDGQWLNQQKLYKQSIKEGVYCCPRAPTNEWNLWHLDHIDRFFFPRLIENMIIFENVNPDRVFLLGYSAGGDGVYKLAPRCADFFAAASMMAGHPNGEPMESLRSLPFCIQCGADDHAYNRSAVTADYIQQLDRLQQADPGGYQYKSCIYPNTPHWMNHQDVCAIPWMESFTRISRPEKIVWRQNHDVVSRRFYWLGVEEPKPDSLLIVSRQGQTFQILEAVGVVGKVSIFLDDTMLNVAAEVIVSQGANVLYRNVPRRAVETLEKTFRGDPNMWFDVEIVVLTSKE